MLKAHSHTVKFILCVDFKKEIPTQNKIHIQYVSSCSLIQCIFVNQGVINMVGNNKLNLLHIIILFDLSNVLL